MRLLTYQILTTLALPFVAYKGYKRCKKHALQHAQQPTLPAIVDCFKARFGLSRQPLQTDGIWIHAVSVGETRSIFPLLSRLKLDYPSLPLTLTSGSTQGAMQALQFAPVPIQHQMIPYDYPFAVNRFLSQIKPKLVIMVETEIWPNLYQACSKRGIPIVLINARLKAQSFYAYQKWGGTMLANALNQTQWIGAQFKVDADYFKALGAHPSKVKTLGNLKFDLALPKELETQAQHWRSQQTEPERFIWVAASTHKSTDGHVIDEELMMLEAHQQLLTQHPNALLILVPRHADRFNDVAHMLEQSSLNWARRGSQQTVNANTQVYLADTIGELMLWFAIGDVAFVGGSLVPFGGHNILEPAALKKPVLSGPHYANLQALFEGLLQQNAVQIVHNTNDLARTLTALAQDPHQRQQLGQQAYQAFSEQSGVLDKVMQHLNPLLLNTLPNTPSKNTPQN